MSKGSNRRPTKVTPKEFMQNWERVFGRSVNKASRGTKPARTGLDQDAKQRYTV